MPVPKVREIDSNLKQAALKADIHKLISTFDENKQTDLLVPE